MTIGPEPPPGPGQRPRRALDTTAVLARQYARHGVIDGLRLRDLLAAAPDRAARLWVLERVLAFAPCLDPDLCRAGVGDAGADDLLAPAFARRHPGIRAATLWSLAIALTPGAAAREDRVRAMRAAGLRPGAFVFGQRILMAETLVEGAAILQEMRACGLVPEPAHYLTLIRAAAGVTAALILVDEMCATGVAVTERHVWAIAGKCRTAADLELLVARMRDLGAPVSRRLLGVVPGYVTRYSDKLDLAVALLGPGATATARDVQLVDEIAVDQALLDASLARGFWCDAGRRDAEIAGRIRAAHTFDSARLLFDASLDAGVLPSEPLYAALAGKAETCGAALRLIPQMRADGVEPGIGFFGAVLGVARSTAARCRVLRAMRAHRVAAQPDTLCSLIEAAPDFAAAAVVYGEARRIGPDDPAPLFEALLSRVRTHADAIRLQDEIRAAGATVPAALLIRTAECAGDFAASATAIASLSTAGHVAAPPLLARWLAQARTFDEGRRAVAAAPAVSPEMRDAWLALARSAGDVAEVLAHPRNVPGIAPAKAPATDGPVTAALRRVICGARGFDAATALLNDLRAAGVAICPSLATEAARRGSSLADTMMVIHDLAAQGVAPDAALFDLAFERAAGFEERCLVIREQAESGLRPRRAMFDALKRTCDSAAELIEACDCWLACGGDLRSRDREEVEGAMGSDDAARALWQALQDRAVSTVEAPPEATALRKIAS